MGDVVWTEVWGGCLGWVGVGGGRGQGQGVSLDERGGEEGGAE